MKILIDLEVPRWVRNVALVVTPAALLVTATAVYADVPNIFKDGDVLSADKMNQNFAGLDSRIMALEQSYPFGDAILARALRGA